MDADGDTKNQIIKREEKEISLLQRVITDVGDVFSAIRLRCSIQVDNGLNGFVLGSRRSFLLNFRIFLFILYIAYETIK